MKTVAIIPARGGSKSIPKKNIKLLGGKPLIAYAIKSSLNSTYVDKVVVSTDDKDIANISKDFNASVIVRPDEISGDNASSEEAILHTLECLKVNENYVPDITVFLQCTSPLTLSVDIDGGINTLINNNADTVFSVTPFHHYIWKRNKDGKFIGINHNKTVREMRQNRELQFLETGSFYIMKTDGFLKSRHRFFGKILTYELPYDRSIEIDYPIDFYVVESIFRRMQQDKLSSSIPHKPEAIVFDFDGVFTDNKVMVNQDGRESVTCSRGDGFGIEKLSQIRIPMFVISKENSTIVEHRCKKLKINCTIGVEDKLEVLKKLLTDNKINPLNTIYVGNDENDIECMKYVGCPVAVGDAVDSVKQVSKIVLMSTGGNGAVRELSELVLINSTNI